MEMSFFLLIIRLLTSVLLVQQLSSYSREEGEGEEGVAALGSLTMAQFGCQSAKKALRACCLSNTSTTILWPDASRQLHNSNHSLAKVEPNQNLHMCILALT